MASRHLSRISVFQALFASDMHDDLSLSRILAAFKENTASVPAGDEDTAFSEKLIRGIVAKRDEIDAVIEKAAPQWPLAKIAAVDRTILRVGLFELLFGDTASVPPKVALNEAIELAKTFGGDSSSRFVNGVMGAVYRSIGSPRKNEAPKKQPGAAKDEKEYRVGVVVCSRGAKAGVSVALVKDPFNRWTLPKARYEDGELSDSAARRAALDELGLNLEGVLTPINEHEYQAHDPKTGNTTRHVGYFVACVDGKPPLHSARGEAVRDAQWFSEKELAALSRYEDLRDIIEAGIQIAKKRAYQNHD